MAHGPDRRRRERYDRLERYIKETEEDLADSGDLGTFEDLLVEDTFATESGTLSITDEELPIETGANPLPSPWQGIRRVGMVLNFSFVWDSDAEEWVRDEGNGGSGGALSNRFRAGADHNGDTTVPAGSFNTQTVPLTTGFGPLFDPDDVIDEANDQWVAPADGTYFFHFKGEYENFTTGNFFQFFLFEVGVRNHAEAGIFVDDTLEQVEASTQIQLSAGDRIEWRTNHDSPNTEEIENGQAVEEFSGFRIA